MVAIQYRHPTGIANCFQQFFAWEWPEQLGAYHAYFFTPRATFSYHVAGSHSFAQDATPALGADYEQRLAGITRGRRAWFYQNWFVFMVVGTLAAFAAWASLEPFFSDTQYLQGPIEGVNPQGLLG